MVIPRTATRVWHVRKGLDEWEGRWIGEECRVSQHAGTSLHRSSSSPGAAAPPTPPWVKAEDGVELEPRVGGMGGVCVGGETLSYWDIELNVTGVA